MSLKLWTLGSSLNKSNILKSYKTIVNPLIRSTTTATTQTVVTNAVKVNTQQINKRIGLWLAGCSGMVAGLRLIFLIVK